MRNKTHLWKRSLAALLCFVMILGMIPVFGMAPAVYAVEGEESSETGATTDDTTTADETSESTGQKTNITGNYITLPITIRDYAADGMLFEYNEVYRTGTNTYTKTDRLYSYTDAPYTATYNPTYWSLSSTDGSWSATGNYTGIRIYPAGAELFETTDYTQVSGANWYCFIVDSNGNILKVLDREATKTNINEIMTEVGGAYSVWAWRDATNVPAYSLLAKVTEDNMDQYQIGFYDTVNATLTAGDTLNFYLGQKYNTAADHQSFYVTTGNNITINSYDNWKRIVCDSDGQIVAVIPVGNTDDYSAYQTSDYTIVMYSKWNTTTEDTTSHITTANMGEYQIVTPTCDVGGALFIERTITINEADTKGFGLLMTSTQDYIHNLYDDGDDVVEEDVDKGFINGSQLISHNSNNAATDEEGNTLTDADGNTITVGPLEVGLWDENQVQYGKQLVYGALIRTNLLTKNLDENTGKPIYTRATVDYLADYMSKIMLVPEKDDSGNYNSYFVKGVKLYDENKQYVGPDTPLAVYDMAEIFRMNVTGGLGDYDTAQTKFNNRQLLYPHQATTWYEAAYYLLHMLWSDSPVDERTGTEGQDGYGMPISHYNRIHLVETKNGDGEIVYVFNAKYDGTTYDYENGEIFNSHFGDYNTENRPYSPAYTRSGSTYSASGNILPAARFDPLGISGSGDDRGYGMSGDTYGDMMIDSWANWAEYYDETNYNMSLEGHAQFVYTQGANQYFTFTGDDDVYLYINGIRVLDVGGAHSIAKVRINLNDVAESCQMVDGGTYKFDFFFLERHGTAANFGIETNIQLAEPSMHTTKTGYQGGVNTGYGGPVDANKHVGYTFELQNDGAAHIYNLEFRDDDIGVYVGWDDVILYPDDFTEEQKKLYDINHLYLIYWDDNGNITEYLRPGDVTVDIIKDRLAKGLAPKTHIGIFGFKYLIQDKQWVDTDGDGEGDTFTNTVYTTANDSASGKGNVLHGVSDWKVVKMQVPYDPFRVYDWVNKDVSQNPATVCDWRSPEEAGLPLGGVTVPKNVLVAPFKNEKYGNDIDVPADARIVLCTAAGYEDEFNLNKNVTLNSDGSVTYKSKTVGKDTVFYKVKWDGSSYNDLVFSYEVYTYGSVNNVYVLDYGLSVELAGETFGFQNNDNLENNHNNREMAVYGATGMMGLVEKKDDEGNTVVDDDGNTVLVWDDITTKDGTYGTFTWTAADEDGNPNSLKYTPDAIINGTDEVYAKFRIMEKEAMENGDEPSIYNSVEMVQKITTAPANVVYYEENFPGITYVNEGENQWVHYETVVEKVDENGDPVLDEDGNPVYESTAGTEQSANQDSNYGSDPNYGAPADEESNPDYPESDKIGILEPVGEVENVLTLNLDTSDLNALQASGIEALNEYFGLGGGDSNGTVNKLEVKQTADVMYFEFTGTGFEIISRTTAEEYAIINVQVQKNNGDGTYTFVRQLPVITESKGGDLYQIPIISITDLVKDNYRVVVQAGTTGNVNRVFYVDGIRIYGPLDNDQALEYYNPAEYQAEFFEVKQMIEDGQMIYSDLLKDEEGNLSFLTGNTMVEDTEMGNILIAVDDVNKYMSVGPNNEFYMDGNSIISVITFTLTPKADYPDAARTLQIGAHRKANSNADDMGAAVLTYASDPQSISDRADAYFNEFIVDATNSYSITSGTEMYYTIDVSKLTKNADGSYLVMLAAIGSEAYGTNLSLTNFKVAGYDISFAQPAIQTAADEGTVDELPMVAQTFNLLRAVREMTAKEPEVEQIPVNENLTINSAALSAAKVATGRTATLTVKADADAQTIVLVDSEGNEVTATRCTRKVVRGVVTFTFIWKVTGSSGQALNYTVRVYDADGLASVNTESVTVTIR